MERANRIETMETIKQKKSRRVPYKWVKTKRNVFENVIAGYDRYNIIHKIERDLNNEAILRE